MGFYQLIKGTHMVCTWYPLVSVCSVFIALRRRPGSCAVPTLHTDHCQPPSGRILQPKGILSSRKESKRACMSQNRPHYFPSTGVSLGVTGGNILLVKSHMNSARQAEASRYLFKVFPGPKERGRRYTAHPGYGYLKEVSQDTHAHTGWAC